MQNINHYFICVEYHTHSTPSKKLIADLRIIIRWGGNQLDHCSLLTLNHLKTKKIRRMKWHMEQYHQLIVK